jgi:hypothetical protein
VLSRRGFLGLLSGAAIAEAAKPIYCFAPPGGWRQSDSGFFFMESTAHGMKNYMDSKNDRLFNVGTGYMQSIYFSNFPEPDRVIVQEIEFESYRAWKTINV